MALVETAISLIVDKLFDVIKDDYQTSKKSAFTQKMFLDSLRETIAASIKRKNISSSDQPDLEYRLNHILTAENFYQYFNQDHADLGFRFRELFNELDLQNHLIDQEDLDFFKQTLLEKLQEKLPDRYQNFLIEEIHRLIKDLFTERSSPVVIKALRESYLNHLYETAGKLTLTGIDRQTAQKRNRALKLNAVYIALLTQNPEIPVDSDGYIVEKEKLFRKTSREEVKRRSSLEQLNRFSRLVLMGDPGSGKSTFVNFVAMCLAGVGLGKPDPEANFNQLTAPLPDDQGEPGKESQTWDHGALLPVRVVLRDFAANSLPAPGVAATAQHLLDFIVRELAENGLGEFAGPMQTELIQQGGLILLDGLDEVPEVDTRREQIKQAVESFANSHPRCRILVTSRTYAYQKEDWKLSNFAEAVLAPFSNGQVRCFVDCWYQQIAAAEGTDRNTAQGNATRLKQAIFAGERLRVLAERPLLLTLMVCLHSWRGGTLPEKREQLYAESVDLLFHSWEEAKTKLEKDGRERVIQPSLSELLKLPNKDLLLEILSEQAFEAHQNQPGLVGTADISQIKLVERILEFSCNPEVKPNRLLEYLIDRAGLIIPRSNRVYTFPHRTFQEYLAACYLTTHDYPNQIAELVRNDVNRWREVALLAGAKAGHGSPFAAWALAKELCCEAVDAANCNLTEQWAALVAGQLIGESIDLTRPIGRTDQKTLPCVRQWLQQIIAGGELPVLERAAAGRALAQLGDPREMIMSLTKMEFSWVPAGPFWMGSKIAKEEKLHLNKQLDYDYWISRYPVSNAQFAYFVKDEGYHDPANWDEAKQDGIWRDGEVKGWIDEQPRKKPYDFGEPFNLTNHPVVGITWYEALAFTRWLTRKWQKEGMIPEYLEVRLPSEAEWEKAARGGEQIPENFVVGPPWEVEVKPELKPNNQPQRNYPWGGADQCEPDLANFEQSGIGATNALGCFPAGISPYGVFELSGNVWEWTRSVYQDYPYNPKDGREKLISKGEQDRRVLRGGSWDTLAEHLRSSYRNRFVPDYRSYYFGFRVVVVARTQKN